MGICSFSANAGLLDYNLALSENLTGAVHVEGMTFVGGNLVSTQMSEFNHKDFTPEGAFDGLEVAGNVSGQMKIMHGETAVYNSKDAGAQIDCVGSINCTTAGVDLSAKKTALTNEMDSLSTSYQSLTANAAASVNGNQVKLIYSGLDDIAVFNLNASDIFFQNSGIELLLGSATKAIINVAGDLDVINTNLTGGWDYANTLWNFYSATSVDFNYMAVKGSVLAANADVFDAAGFDGSLYAKSYTNSSLREIHGFFWTPPTTETEVPEPSILILLLAGLGLIGLGRLRRQS
jgi:choice-of-anchor A domain-containing protein